MMNPTSTETPPRDIIRNRLLHGMIGPGSDVFALPIEEEVISDYPLIRYFSGMLFPAKGAVKSQKQDDDCAIENETAATPDTLPDIDAEIAFPQPEESKIAESSPPETSIREAELPEQRNHFFPGSLALTFCVESETESVQADFSFALYYQPHQQEVRIAMPEPIFQIFLDEKCAFPFRHLLRWEDGILWLDHPLKGNKTPPRTDDFARIAEYRHSLQFRETEIRNVMYFFEKLTGRAWKRNPYRFSKNVLLPKTPSEYREVLFEAEGGNLRVEFFVKTWFFQNRKYAKIGLINSSPAQPPNRFTNQTPELNQRCLFQASIAIETPNLLPYRSFEDFNFFDDPEAEELNLLFGSIKNYGIGHNCAVEWNQALERPRGLCTTFLPEYDVRDVKNKFDREEQLFSDSDYNVLDASHNLSNLSIFSLFSQKKVVDNLEGFISLYASWIEGQKKRLAQLEPVQQSTGQRIISRQEKNLDRLLKNLKLLEDERIFKAFQLANTAMLLQIIISSDKRFTKEEKDLGDLANFPTESIYNNFAFFKNYDASGIRYRPFQLAFLLLSLEGIVQPESESRCSIVDLIWFPTGGGKTEAYLAVAAFSIIWRRLNDHKGNSRGVAVLMRYTLRLLTAQQFERASKLVVALEFLRRQFLNELGSEPIRIGLWVGNQLTPGSLSDTKGKIDAIESECNRIGGSPESKNVFQISACPWCGTKLLSQGSHGWQRGFELARNRFFLRCLNQDCAFHQELPVQVVDEMLYREPPTLLFATVDKFAQLAWREETHLFFNSLTADHSLPPDLIIQDELHLLSGPLGSIVGLFESVVEMLATQQMPNGTRRLPKIIASTATTRNTGQQVAQLYGNREVNIFPPSGLTYEDSFFARQATSSRRRYVGFMPSGKTGIDAQLNLLAHLLVARLETNDDLTALPDNYWTVVSYYNSLRDVGRINNKVGDEIKFHTQALQNRLFRERRTSVSFNTFALEDRVEELTSRIESSKIKATLKKLENPLKIIKNGSYLNVTPGIVDLVLATNMFSVGIDIGRLNLMLINGMPKNVTEYIQASSRVGRNEKGLVVAFLDANRARDKSYFEHFLPFHAAFYKNIEPLSITPFTENTLEKMLTTLLAAFVRNAVASMASNSSAGHFQKDMLTPLETFLHERFAMGNPEEWIFLKSRMQHLAEDWEARARLANGKMTYKQLLKRPGEVEKSQEIDWITMQSMREVDADTFITLRQTPDDI